LIKTKIWDVFPDDMGLENNVELALTNVYLNEPMLEPVTFDDGDPLEGPSSTSTDANLGLDIHEEEEEDGGARVVVVVVILMILTWRRTVDSEKL
jgi:hypothetical protein